MPSSDLWIGVATTVVPKPRVRDGESALRPPLYYCRMAGRVHEGGARLVLFDPKNIDWQVHRISGWTPANAGQSQTGWMRVSTPLPAAIYENVFVHLAMRGYCTPMRKMARLRRIPLFNPPLPDKWRMVRLMEASALRQYLPETERLRDSDAAVQAIRRWQTAYIKPVGGYGGMGVTRVEALPDGRFRVSVDRPGKQVHSSREEVTEQHLRAWIRRRARRTHLLQKGIPLLTIDGRRVDFRVVCQRGSKGEWAVVGIVPKVAAVDGVVSNLVAGGSRASIEELQLRARRGGKQVPVEALERCALQIAEVIGRYRKTTGIVGFDIGADEEGRVWLIEMNPKPARSLLDDPQRRISARLAAEYSLFLAVKKSYN